MAKKKYCVYNTSRETFLSLGVHAADTAVSRLRGLLGKLKLTTEDGLWVVPSRGVHTLGLLFPLDLIYLDADCRVIHLQESFQPFGVAPLIAQAASVLQLATHSIYSSHTQLGDKMLICVAEEMEQRLKQGIVSEPPLVSVLADKIATGPLSLLVRPFAGRSGQDRKTPKAEADLGLVSVLEMAIGGTAKVQTAGTEESIPVSATSLNTKPKSSGRQSEWNRGFGGVEDRSDSSKGISSWRPGLMTAMTALEKEHAPAGPRPVQATMLESKRTTSESKSNHRMPSTYPLSGLPAAEGAAAAIANYSRRKEDMAWPQSRQVRRSSPALAMPLRQGDEPDPNHDMHLVAGDSKDLTHFFRVDEVLLKITDVHDGKPGGVCVVKTSKSESTTGDLPEVRSIWKEGGLSTQSGESNLITQVASEATQQTRGRTRLVPVASVDPAAAHSEEIEATRATLVSPVLETSGSKQKAATAKVPPSQNPVQKGPPQGSGIEKSSAVERLPKQGDSISSSPESFLPSDSPSPKPLGGDEITPETQVLDFGKDQVKSTGTARAGIMPKLYQWLFHRDRRRDDRRPVDNLIAYFWSGGRPEPQTVRDISATGLYLETDERWYPGTVIRMTLQKGGGDDIAPDAIAVESMAVRQDENGVGLRFVLPDATKGELPVNANFDGAGSKELKAFLKRFLMK